MTHRLHQLLRVQRHERGGAFCFKIKRDDKKNRKAPRVTAGAFNRRLKVVEKYDGPAGPRETQYHFTKGYRDRAA